MDRDRDKRPSDEVLFRWDPRTHSMNFDTSEITDDVFIKRRMTESKKQYDIHDLINNLGEKESRDLTKSFNESTTDGLNLNPELLHKQRDKRSELMKNLKKFQLNSCKDWLGSNTNKSSIEKVDTLDRLSSIIINPEFPIKHESILYSIQLGKSDYDFYNALFVTKLSRMSNVAIMELIRQPIYIRNRMLLLTDKKKCNCPLSILTKQQPHQRHFLQPKASHHHQPTHPQGPSQPYHQHQGSFGDGFLNRLAAPHSNLLGPNIFGGERTYSNLFGLDRRIESECDQDHVNENDIVCPFHMPSDLPQALKSPKGLCGVIEYYNLFYKYEEVKILNKNCHVLSLYNLESNKGCNESHAHMKGKYGTNRVYQYRLPSKLLAVNHVYLRDFEYERYYSTQNMYNSGTSMETSTGVEKEVYLSKMYSGDALFIVTKSEIIIALVNVRKGDGVRMSVILRDNNHRRDVKEVMCHRDTGRIFMLESSSLLYEYQYQLGFTPSSFKDNRVIKYLYNTIKYTKCKLLNMVRNNRVYNLGVRPINVSPNEQSPNVHNNNNRPVEEGVMGDEDVLNRLLRNNCLDEMESSVTQCTCYYPPLEWKEVNYSTMSATNLFRPQTPGREGIVGSQVIGSLFRKEVEVKEFCRCGFGCRAEGVKRNVKCLNPWNKKFMKTGESIAVLDQKRWTLSLFNKTSGDLSVFYIHGYTTIEDHTSSERKNERVFPYDLTLFNLKHGSIVSALERLGYGRFSFGSRFVKILPAPTDFVDGVDLILVDNNGVKVFIGFSNSSLTTHTSLISTSLATNLGANLSMDTIRINAASDKVTTNPSKIGLCVKGFRVPFRHMSNYPRGPFALFRSKSNVTTFLLENMFMTMEPVRKVQNGTLVRLVLTKNDSSSYFQNHKELPLSINEEFYMFNENTVQYKTVEENQPLEYYHEFYIKLDDKEKIITAYESNNTENYKRWNKAKLNRTYNVNYNSQINAENHQYMDIDDMINNSSGYNYVIGDTSKYNSNREMVNGYVPMRGLDNVFYIVTTERVYSFSKLDEGLVLKSLVRYPKNTLKLIKAPPLMNSNTYMRAGTKGLPKVVDGETGMGLVAYNNGIGSHNARSVLVNGEEPVFNISNYMDKRDGTDNYFISSIERDAIEGNNWDMNRLEGEVYEYGKDVRDNSGPEGLNRYLSRMNRNDMENELFKNIFGDDLIDICENSSELIGYSLYYMSWLYGPENMFKQIFNYLTDMLIKYSSSTTSMGLSSSHSKNMLVNSNANDDYNGINGTDRDVTNTISDYTELRGLVENNTMNTGDTLLSEHHPSMENEINLNVLSGDVMYNYLFTNSVEGYNAFIASFGIPYKIFNYVAPGCYSVCEDGFEKPVISPWCKFVSFQQKKVKRNRVVTNTTPLVDGLVLTVSELLTPMYYNRVFDIVPHTYTTTVTSPYSTGPLESGTPSSFSYFNSNTKESPYLMEDINLNRVENVNEFVVGERVDMYLTLELSMGIEASKSLLNRLYSLHLIVMELIKDYQKCNLENVVQILSTLAPNVVRMVLEPMIHQHEPYPTSHSVYSHPDSSTATTTVRDFYHKNTNTSGQDDDEGVFGNDVTQGLDSLEAHEGLGFRAERSIGNSRRSSTDSRSVNKILMSRLENMIRERFENDLRTLKELATVLQVSQEFLASSMLLHNNIVLGECDYDFDKNLHLLNLLPSKTPNSFFSPLDFSLNWSNENRYIFPFNVKMSHESPKSKLVLTKSIMNLMAQSNLINVFMNKEFFRLFRIVVWLVGENVSSMQKHFFGHMFTFDEIGVMNNCNRIKFLQRQLENTDDVAKAEYIQSLIKQFTIT